MRKIKIALCALIVLCSGFIFAACGEQGDQFSVGKISVSTDNQFTYDGRSHMIEVEYNQEDLDVDIEYAVVRNENDKVHKGDFDDEINLVNAGTYYVYYKLSADGYEDYISEKSYKLSILPKSINLTIGDLVQLKSLGLSAEVNPEFNIADGAIVPGDEVDVGFMIGNPLDDGEAFNTSSTLAGRQFAVNAVSMNPNYTLEGAGKLYIKDLVEVSNGTTTRYYGDLKTAIQNASANAVIKLNSDVVVEEGINSSVSLTIDGQGNTIKASDNFVDSAVVVLTTENVELKLKNVTIDGNLKSRVVIAKKGKLVLEDTNITKGKAIDYVGGVYITNNAQFVMTGGSIKDNTFENTDQQVKYYEQYSTDLWIGANAIGAINEITNAEIGNIFVNANSYSKLNQGSFTLNGGKVTNIYVEYHNGEEDNDYGAIFNYTAGEIEHLLVSTTVEGEFVEISVPTESAVIKGGVIGTVKDSQGMVKGFLNTTEFANYSHEHPEDYKTIYVADVNSLAYAINDVQEVILIGDIVLNNTQTLTLNDTDRVIINGQNKYTIKASDEFSDKNLFNITGNEVNAVITLKDVTLDGNNKTRVIKVDSGKLVIDGATITKGKATDYVGGVFVTSSASFELISGSIVDNSYVDAADTDEYYKRYSVDLWIGANATGSMAAINGGTVGKMFVNANESCAVNDPNHISFIMNNGYIESVYVEFEDYAAIFKYVAGEIDKLYLSTQTVGASQLIENPTTGNYVGGTGVVA